MSDNTPQVHNADVAEQAPVMDGEHQNAQPASGVPASPVVSNDPSVSSDNVDPNAGADNGGDGDDEPMVHPILPGLTEPSLDLPLVPESERFQEAKKEDGEQDEPQQA